MNGYLLIFMVPVAYIIFGKDNSEMLLEWNFEYEQWEILGNDSVAYSAQYQYAAGYHD